VRRDGDKLIGYVGLRLTPPDLRQGYLTIQLNPAFRRQGFATETLAAVQKFCFEEVKLHRLSASCDSRNEAALSLLQKVGFRREGEFVKDTLLQGEWSNTVWYAVLREEHERARAGAGAGG
jgi:aminoglycoside 6'-N-acetyltransferase